MKKVTLKSFMIVFALMICTVVGCSFFGSSLLGKEQITPDAIIPQDCATPASTSMVTTSEIFTEITSDGLASYLKISIPIADDTAINSIIIKQTVGDASYTISKDEVGTSCYYINELGSAKNTEFYFTRPATYTVYYSTASTEKTETCTFTPALNETVVSSLSTTSDSQTLVRSNISKNDKGYFFLSSGNITFPTDTYNLYTLSASTIDKTTGEAADIPTLLTYIPSGTYGLVTYTLESANNCAKLELPIYVLTTEFSIEFETLSGSPITKEDYYFLSSGYCFNMGVKSVLTITNSSTNLLGIALTDEEKKEAFSHLSFNIKSEVRNETNTAYATTSLTTLEKNNSTAKQEIVLPKADNTTHTISASLNNELTTGANRNIVKIKIITKIPKNENGNYIFSAILGQVEKNDTNDYISGVLNGYMEEGTVIYYAAQAVRVYYNGYESSSTNLKYIYNNSEFTIEKGYHKDFTTNAADPQAQIINNGSIIQFENNTISFDNFFIFSAAIETYDTGYRFRENLLNGQMFKNGNTLIQVSPDANQTITEAISSYKYVVPSNYNNNFIPIYLKVTYNGTEFENVYKFTAGDEIIFNDYGEYLLEFYNIPSYEFLAKNLSSLGESLYHYTINFTIAGPSIYAYQGTEENKHTISNNMYTQGTVTIKADINAGQKILIYKNNELYYQTEESLPPSNLINAGTWKISIVNDQGTELKNLTFTIMDTIYQGFSINNKEEYESLIIYKKVSSLPVVLEKLPEASSYHILEPNDYRIVLNTKENLNFYVNGRNASAFTITESTINFTIAKPYFSINFTEGSAGGRISSKIEIISVSGIELQSMEVFKNNKSVALYTAADLENWDNLTNTKSFSENGIYTIRIVDKFGNVYETQIEKYYKVNVALIFLILIISAAIIVLIITILKARHKIKVK